jgi:hypothetical protein
MRPTIKELKEEIRNLGGTMTERREKLNGGKCYQVDAPGFNSAVLYQRGDIEGRLLGMLKA